MKTEHISGFQDRKIEVSYEGDFDTEMLFVLIPGYDYNLDHPLFYYLRQFLKDKQLNHLSFHFNWSRQKELFSQPGEQVFKSLGNEIGGAFELARSKAYKRLFIIAKSLGTAALQQIRTPGTVKEMGIQSLFWITPFLNTPGLVDLDFEIPVKDYFYVGTEDSFYDKDVYAALKSTAAVREFEGLGHSFEVNDDIIQSVKGLENVLRRIREDILEETGK